MHGLSDNSKTILVPGQRIVWSTCIILSCCPDPVESLLEDFSFSKIVSLLCLTLLIGFLDDSRHHWRHLTSIAYQGTLLMYHAGLLLAACLQALARLEIYQDDLRTSDKLENSKIPWCAKVFRLLVSNSALSPFIIG